MGICPYRRDQNAEVLTGALQILPNQEWGSELQSKHSVKYVQSLESAYTVLGPVDQSARIFRAESVEFHWTCFIRVLPKTLLRLSAGLEVLLKLDCPSLLKIYDVCQDDSHLYIISEPYESGDLEDYLQSKGFLGEKQAALIMHQLLTALTRCHQAGLVHRAIDLQAIALKDPPTDEKIQVKLKSWENFDEIVDSGKLDFTWFTAPEMARGECTAKCDIWSCGVILYLLLCGRPPFGTSKPTASRLKGKGLTFPPSIWSHVRRDAIDLIMQMLDERPDARPSALQCLAHPWIRHFSRLRSSSRANRPSSGELRATGTSIRKGVLLFMIMRTTSDLELSRLSAAFNTLDKDGDGVISPEELMEGLKIMMSAERAGAEVSKAVTAGNAGRISFSEFLLAAVDPETLICHDKMQTAFDSTAHSASGRISIVDLKLQLRISPAAEAQWKTLLADLDTQGDAIAFSDFEALIIKALKA